MKKITDRLHRVSGQIDGLEKAIAEGRSCEDVVPQMLAVKGAMNGIVQTYLEESLENCIDESDTKKMKNLIKTLIKNSN